jgi:hypothetical protein
MLFFQWLYIDYAGAYKDQQQSFKIVTYFNGFVFISFGVLLFLFRNKSGFHPVVYFSSGYCWQLFIIVLTNTPLNVGSTTD